MSEYLVQRQSLENIADEIRELSGTTEPLGLTEMATNVNDANAQVAEIEGLIGELNAALDGKSVSGGGASVETRSLYIRNCEQVYYTGKENGVLVAKKSIGTNSGSTHHIEVCLGLPIVCGNVSFAHGAPQSCSIEDLGNISTDIFAFILTDTTSTTPVVIFANVGGSN